MCLPNRAAEYISTWVISVRRCTEEIEKGISQRVKYVCVGPFCSSSEFVGFAYAELGKQNNIFLMTKVLGRACRWCG